jgi:hypothetical protein
VCSRLTTEGLDDATDTSWLNTTDGIHLFQTFDHLMRPDTIINDITTQVDYVWGASDHHIAAYRHSKHPSIKLSSYIPYNRDPGSAR